MKRFRVIVGVLCTFALAAGCEKKPETTVRVVETEVVTPQPVAPAPVAKTATFETDELKESIDRYLVAPTAENQVEVQKAFAELDVEIAELQEDVLKQTDPEDKAEAVGKLRNLSEFRAAERVRFAEAQARAVPVVVEPRTNTGHEIKEDLKDAGHQIKDDLKDAGHEIKEELKDIVR